jgi:hypothetical protein
MSNIIKIHRPINRREQFDADEHTARELVFECLLPETPSVKTKEEAAELMFHILNAPIEYLSIIERKIATTFRTAPGQASLSTGDVVEVDEVKFLCESIGWREI